MNDTAKSVLARTCVLLLLVIATQQSAVQAADDNVSSIEATTAYKLLSVEREVRDVPASAEALFRLVVADATEAAADTRRHPRSREEALAVLEAIQVALTRHNFLQPSDEKDWPQTMGSALIPLKSGDERIPPALDYYRNERRLPYLDATQPMYFVDCDMGAQFFIAVGERLGWDIRLVEIPKHNFVRWHLSETSFVNWDWTRWGSVDDEDYRGELPPIADPRLRSFYLRSLDPKEARGYYLGLIGSEALEPLDGERLLREAMTALPSHPLTLNNLAWLYATNRVFAGERQRLAVSLGLAAWSTRPLDGNYADTVACALAADGEVQLAEGIELYAMRHASGSAQREAFSSNLARIKEGELCNP